VGGCGVEGEGRFIQRRSRVVALGLVNNNMNVNDALVGKDFPEMHNMFDTISGRQGFRKNTDQDDSGGRSTRRAKLNREQ
jgi:hypothetical protein